MSLTPMLASLDTDSSPSCKPLKYLITITPLGFLYGSTGGFLSPDNLVGRSGTNFPPSAATAAGLLAAFHEDHKSDIKNTMQVAGPFWAWQSDIENFYVPTPLHCLVEDSHIQHCLRWQDDKWQTWDEITKAWEYPPDGKFSDNTWLNLSHWKCLSGRAQKSCPPIPIESAPWKPNPHLHPELQHEQRHTQEGRLFLEHAIELHPDACLVYLSSHPIESNKWYRFGGEGHMAEVGCHPIPQLLQTFLSQSLENCFALITPAVWGSNRFSQRHPDQWKEVNMLTTRPKPFRYRRGKILSRGRYAVSAGTVYNSPNPEESWQNLPWQDWPKEWFPKEGIFLKQLGCGLALPL
jgi:CRISPR-associated protein Cmr3